MTFILFDVTLLVMPINSSLLNITTVKTLYNDAGRTADRIVIPMVLLYIESRVGLISRKKEADAWLSIPKGYRASTSRAK